MNLTRRLLLVTFIESVSTTMVERGVYFFTHDKLAFSDGQNLWVALAFGAAYVVGALSSHRMVRWAGSEKRLLLAAVAGQLAIHAGMAVGAMNAVAVVIGSTLVGAANGVKWPLMESFVSAGHSGRAAVVVVGRYNLSWAIAVPLGLVAAGPLIASAPPAALFVAAAALNVAAIGMLWPVPSQPPHLPDDHPDRPNPRAIARYSALLPASRWLMLSSYAFMWILAALLPQILASLGRPTSESTAVSGLLDVMRLATFILLQFWHGWHDRIWPLVAAMVILPGAFAAIMFGNSLAVVIAGEMVFGVGAGIVYYASLYYAMVVKNASVDAGGAHEGLIGGGFALGPAAALVGLALAPSVGGPVAGTLLSIGPLFIMALVMAVRPLVRMPRR